MEKSFITSGPGVMRKYKWMKIQELCFEIVEL